MFENGIIMIYKYQFLNDKFELNQACQIDSLKVLKNTMNYNFILPGFDCSIIKQSYIMIRENLEYKNSNDHKLSSSNPMVLISSNHTFSYSIILLSIYGDLI